MFTGIIDHKGTVLGVLKKGNTRLIKIQSNFDAFEMGESIAVDGACLTVSACEQKQFTVEVSEETLSKTIAASYEIGTEVNLEKSLRVGDRLSGHFVLGHIDRTATVNEIKDENGFRTCQIGGFKKEEQRYLVPKGSIAINGVSLTINEINSDGALSFTWIPHTLLITTLGKLTTSDLVNIEFDYLAKIAAGNKLI